MNHAALRVVLLVFAAIVLWIVCYSIASKPTVQAPRLGMRGLKRQRALLHSPSWSEVEPLVRWLGVRASPWISPGLRSRLDRKLTYAGDYLGLTADEWAAVVTLAAASGSLAGLVVSVATEWRWGAWPMFLGLVLGALWPIVRLDRERELRLRAINQGLPYAVDLLALSMSAGLDFPGALLQLVDKSRSSDDHLMDELRFLLQQLELGSTRASALIEFQQRAPSEAVRELVQALVHAEEHGNPVAAVLQIQAGIARAKRANMAQQAAQNMNSKMVLPIFMMVGVTMVLIVLPTQKMMEQLVETLR